VSIRERIFAACYDPMSRRWEERYGADLRRQLLVHARGRVLDVGVGTGQDLPHYPADIEEIVAAEPSKPMLQRAQRRAEQSGRHVTFANAPAEALPFEDSSFDTAVVVFVLCTVADPARSLAEIHRVLKPGGRLLFMEHVRSGDDQLARWQDRLERPWGIVSGGCHPNRDSLTSIEAAGFEVKSVERRDQPGMPQLVRPFVCGTATRR
jgi:ubiquinone/menaquinone biosynthesis C-methylase UbiE